MKFDQDASKYACKHNLLGYLKWSTTWGEKLSSDHLLISCKYGHLEVAKWIKELDPTINHRANNDFAFRWACHNGHLEVAKWLKELDPDIDYRACKDFIWFANSQLEIVKWIKGLDS